MTTGNTTNTWSKQNRLSIQSKQTKHTIKEIKACNQRKPRKQKSMQSKKTKHAIKGNQASKANKAWNQSKQPSKPSDFTNHTIIIGVENFVPVDGALSVEILVDACYVLVAEEKTAITKVKGRRKVMIADAAFNEGVGAAVVANQRWPS